MVEQAKGAGGEDGVLGSIPSACFTLPSYQSPLCYAHLLEHL